MRVTPCRAALGAAVALNLLLLLCSRLLLPAPAPGCRRAGPRELPGGVTVVLREFDSPRHDVAATARSFSSLPGVSAVLVASESSPYPPAALPPGVAFLPLRPEPGRPAPRPEEAVRTRHVALVPDGARAAPGLLRRMRDALENGGGDVRVVAAAVGRAKPTCLRVEMDVRTWTVRYGRRGERSDPRGARCGGLEGAPAVLLLRSRDLFSLPFPLSRPVVTSLSLQASLRGWSLLLLPDSFPQAPLPPPTPHERWKAQNSQERRHRALMEEFGVKLELLPDGRQRWHGCAKDTPRCFGTVLAQTPRYLLAGRWTPPCCLRALRLTARHVLAQLEASGVRHWLEGGSLLGAVRLGDLIPWDYDVDVGLYRDDVPKCRWLAAVAATGRPVEDPQGFLWEKAAEGEFYRVHFSRTNRLHVDLWPFYPGDGGLMTKETWLGHGQDVEFPERFLVPLGAVGFVGVRARAPNDPRAFLELKFGPGAVERPEYPNPGVRRLEEDLGNKTWR